MKGVVWEPEFQVGFQSIIHMPSRFNSIFEREHCVESTIQEQLNHGPESNMETPFPHKHCVIIFLILGPQK